MAIKTFEELRALAIIVRDEKLNKANSANRIGSLMLEQINKIEESYNHFPESDYKDLKNHVATITKAANYEVLEYQVSIATTRLKVKEENRKGGYMITYNPGTGWIKEQYIGELTTNEEWIKDENWKAEVLDENIQAIAENALQQANLAATNAALAEEKATEAAIQAAYAKEQGDLAATRGGVPEAPSDGKQYARENETWVEVEGGGVGKVDPNSDGTGEIFNSYEGTYGNVASGDYSHAEGYETEASGPYSHAEGYGNTASESQAHAEGYRTTASGNSSHAEGYGTTSSGYYTHAEGKGTGASGYGSHAEGQETTASGDYSHAEGIISEASGYGSHAGGYQGVANTFAQTAIGYKNTPEEYSSPTSFDATKAAFIIGNDGNAFKVLFNGQTFADGNYSSTGADYAEMFEWLDGNPTNEDRVGRFVTLKGKNIEIANETSTYILGIVSGAPTIIGDNPMRWQGKYLNDEWGRPIYEDEERVFVRNIKKKDGTIETKEEVKVQHIRKVNPNYDPMERYIPRIERPEWDFVGMMGKLLVRQDGTLTEGGFCKPSTDGVATKADNGYYVMEIINESQALILFK